MKKQPKIIELEKHLQERNDIFFPATVTKVTGNSCTVKVSNLTFKGVSLKSSNNLLIIPKIGSNVTVWSQNENFEGLLVVKVDHPEKIIYDNERITLVINKESGSVLTFKK